MKMLRIPLVIVLALVAGRTFTASAQMETILHSFVGYPTDGSSPVAGLVQGSDGNFYGTTQGGGTHSDGTVFELDVGLALSAPTVHFRSAQPMPWSPQWAAPTT